jgi:ABC-type dipeptide/oligopeptide/nickel transport system permease subunit
MAGALTATPAGRPKRLGGWLGGWGQLGLAITVLAVAIALLGPALSPFDPLAPSGRRLLPPSSDHWLGLDALGRDVLSRLITGTQISIAVGLAATLMAFALGAGLGLLACAVGGPLAWLFLGAMDLLRTLPSILLALVLVAAIGTGTGPVTFALGLAFAPVFARVARAGYLREMGSGYVTAARGLGASRVRLVLVHAAPNLVGPLLTQAAIILPRVITKEAVLSFFGVGAAPEAPTWGRLIAEGTRFVERAPHLVLAPVLALAVVTLGLSLLGDATRRRLDPNRVAG